MLYLPKEVAEFKSDKLSHAMVSQLIRVSHYTGLIKGQARATPLKSMLFKIMLIAEIRYINALQGSDYSYEEILVHIYSGKEKDTLKQQYLRLLESVEYIRQVTSVYPAFPATDILKINELLSNEADGILQSKDIQIHMETVSAEQELNVSPKTAISYLKKLEEYGFLKSIKAGREKLYINCKAFEVMKSCM